MTLDHIPLAGVIGSPVAHSRSPQLHGHWLKTYGLSGHYIPMDVSSGNLKKVLKALPKMGFVGVNITIPHKERVMDLADHVSDRATLIGAANTLIFRADGTLFADNTDGYGFIENLRQGAPEWKPDAGPAVVLGAGGASRAIVSSLLDAGVPQILVSNRTRVRAEQIREDFGTKVQVVEWVQAGNILEDAATVVNTTSLGMAGKPELRVPLDGLNRASLVTDLVYNPLQTQLLAAAEAVGCKTVDGLGMLLHQAVPGFERWFGIRPEVTADLRKATLA